MIAFIIYLLISILFAFICASMAKNRNRSGGLWGVLGFFFGLIAVLILAIIGKSTDGDMVGSGPAPGYQPITDQSSPPSRFDEIAKLKTLLDDGTLTQEEFDAEKRKLLG